MNLIKYFNFNYLKENIKKSKGIILLLIISIPLFTILSLILVCNNIEYTKVINETEIIIPNLIGMYLIPFLLSVSLFGYVYKKSSVDFINSMPINRKTIFITNTIGGILLITLLQIVTLILTLLCNCLVSRIIIFPAMLIDIFITMWIAYFFMFCATNLAMSLSGTVLTQAVLTMIIIFIVPFCMLTFKSIIENKNYENESEFYEKELFISVNSEGTYTLPFNIISYYNGNIFSPIINTKMMVLGIVYLILGLVCFQNKKMENAEESFSSIKVHLFVKALTVFPMIVILNLLEETSGFNIFVIGLIIIYYFAYDFIIKRKIKFPISVISLILTLSISQLIVLGIGNIKIDKENIQREDIQKIAISLDRYDDYINKNLYIDNSEIIDLIYNSAEELNKKKDNITYIYLESEYEDENEYENVQEIMISINLILKDEEKFCGYVSIKQEDFDKVIELLEEDKEYVENVKNEYLKNGIICMGEHAIIENNKEINELIGNEIKKMNLKQIYDMDEGMSDLTKYFYNNHRLISKTISINLNKDALKLIADSENKLLKEKLNKMLKDNTYSVIIDINQDLGYDTEEFKEFGGQFSYTDKKMEDFIINNIDDEFDSSKKGYCIRIYSYGVSDTNFYFFTNKVDEVNEIIKLEEEQIRKNEKYNKFYESDVVYND